MVNKKKKRFTYIVCVCVCVRENGIIGKVMHVISKWRLTIDHIVTILDSATSLSGQQREPSPEYWLSYSHYISHKSPHWHWSPCPAAAPSTGLFNCSLHSSQCEVLEILPSVITLWLPDCLSTLWLHDCLSTLSVWDFSLPAACLLYPCLVHRFCLFSTCPDLLPGNSILIQPLLQYTVCCLWPQPVWLFC